MTTLNRNELLAKPVRVAVTLFGYYLVITEDNKMVAYYTDSQGVVRYEYCSGLKASDVVVDSKDNVYVALNSESKIAKITFALDSNGIPSYTTNKDWATNPSNTPSVANDFLYKPQALAIDPTDDSLYVLNKTTSSANPPELMGDYMLVKIKPTGAKKQADVEKYGSGIYYNFNPAQMTADPKGNIIFTPCIASQPHAKVQIVLKSDSHPRMANPLFTSALPFADSVEKIDNTNGRNYRGVAFDKARNMFLSEGTRLYMLKFDSSGKPIKTIELAGNSQVSTVATYTGSTVDGTGDAARFGIIYGLTVDANHNVIALTQGGDVPLHNAPTDVFRAMRKIEPAK